MFFLISEEAQTDIIYQKKRTTLRKAIIMIKKQDEKKFALTDVDPIAYKTARTFCAKRFLVLSQTILQSAENGFRTCRHPFYKPCRGEYRVKRRCECFPEGILSSHSSYKRIFTRKGSHPSDALCTNALR